MLRVGTHPHPRSKIDDVAEAELQPPVRYPAIRFAAHGGIFQAPLVDKLATGHNVLDTILVQQTRYDMGHAVAFDLGNLGQGLKSRLQPKDIVREAVSLTLSGTDLGAHK